MVDPNLQFPDPPTTASEQWLDANIRHQIGLMRVSGGVSRQIRQLLDATEADLRRAIRRTLDRTTSSPAGLARLERLLSEVAAIRNTAWRQVRTKWLREMEAIAVAEPGFMDALLKTVVPTRLSTTLPPEQLMRSLVTSRPFEGRTMRQWASSVRRADINRIQDQIKIGVVQGESGPDIARRVVGTVRLRGRNGVTQIARRDAEGITRTAVNHYANQSRREFFKANAEFFDDEIYIATLDGNTTPICRSLDGERFPIGEGPIPPLHFKCRSLRTAILGAEAIGMRPMKPVTERGLLREFAERQGFAAPRRRVDLPRGTKGAFDAFARKRTRELIGRVPSKTTYTEFLNRQSREFQDDVLGRTRGRLFRSGGLELKQFVNRAGDEINLDELARMHASAFTRAGLDPEAFLVPN